MTGCQMAAYAGSAGGSSARGTGGRAARAPGRRLRRLPKPIWSST